MDENLNFDVKVTISEIKKALNIPFIIKKKKNRPRKKKGKENE
jgi:hypothetical protein